MTFHTWGLLHVNRLTVHLICYPLCGAGPEILHSIIALRLNTHSLLSANNLVPSFSLCFHRSLLFIHNDTGRLNTLRFLKHFLILSGTTQMQSIISGVKPVAVLTLDKIANVLNT